MQLQEKQRSETLQQILVIFENTIQALMACYDIFRTDGPEIQQEWIKHVKQVDNRLE